MAQNGRESSGQFATGNPGRPVRAIEAEYLGVLSERVTIEKWRRMVARAGQWLGQYLIADHKTTNVDVTAEKGITVLEVDDWYGTREALDQGIEKQKISQANAR